MFIRKLKNKLRDRLWVVMKAKWKLRSQLEVIIENDSDWFVYNEIFTNKEYDDALSYLLKNLPNKPFILDLGANVGYFTLKVADEINQAGVADFRIIALEASPINYTALAQRLDQETLKGKVTTILGLAGHKTGSHSVVHSEQHYGHSAISDRQRANEIKVDYIDIDKLLPENIQRIDFLKCDIEGSEEIFLSEYSSLLQKVENAVFEFHAAECDIPKCRLLLEKAGLRSKGVIKEDAHFKTSVEIFSRHQ